MPYKRDNSVSPERRHWSASPPPGTSNGAGPSKRVMMTTNDFQRRTLNKLLQNPNKEVELPGPFLEKPLEAPPDMVKNISGSVSGAGSGEFHVYKASRRREFERLKRMEQHTKDRKAKVQFEEQAAFKERQAAREAEAEAKLAKNRNKRLKRKAGRKGGGGGGGVSGQGANGGTDGEGVAKRKLANGSVGLLGRGEPTGDGSGSEEDEDGAEESAGAGEAPIIEPPKAVETRTVVHDDD